MILYLIAYLIGSLQGGILLTKCFKAKDPRLGGSKNTGTTNVWRLHGYRLGLATFVFDAGKIFLIAEICHTYFSHTMLSIALLMGLIGHIYPIYHGFKGGKGIASFFALTALVEPYFCLVAAMIWLVVFIVTQTSGLAAILSLLMLLIVSIGSNILHYSQCMFVIIIACFLCLWKHANNFKDWLNGYRATQL